MRKADFIRRAGGSFGTIATRESLLGRLKNWDDAASWTEFFDTYWRLIYAVARRARLNDAEAQDVVQETILAVAKKMPDFNYDPAVGSFKGWLLKLTQWRITDHFRKKQYEKAGQRFPREQPLTPAMVEDIVEDANFDLEAAWEEEWRQNILELAIERVKRSVSPKPYQLFSLHYLKGIPARVVAETVGVKLAQVYVASYKVSAAIRRQIKQLEKELE